MDSETYKFRAWDEDGYMFVPSKIEITPKEIIVWENNLSFGTLGTNCGVVALMRFTGKQDKDGKDIYEDDIVMWPSKGVWSDQCSKIEIIKMPWLCGNANKCKVIGNKWEHRELLRALSATTK